MARDKKNITLTMAILDYFGRLPGETLGGFADEIRALSHADKAEFQALLEGEGYVITKAV